jgi:uncharacterized protein YhhL (DUF1145 family)
MSDSPIQEQPNHRRVLLRRAVIFTPGAVIATAVWLVALFNLVTGNAGAIFAVVLVGMIALALDFEALASLRDLRSEPKVTKGLVLRKWVKSRVLIFGHVYYVRIGGSVFELRGDAAHDVIEGDALRVEHWPRTNVVITVHRIPAGDHPAAEPD